MPGRTIEPDIEEAIREAEEELSPKREEQIDQSRGNTGKRNVRVVKSEALSKPYEWRFVVLTLIPGRFWIMLRDMDTKQSRKQWQPGITRRETEVRMQQRKQKKTDKRLDETPQRLCGCYGTVLH